MFSKIIEFLDKLFLFDQSAFKSFWACFGSCMGWLLGGFDVALLALLVLYVLDFMLGFYRAWMQGAISWTKIRRGLMKTVFYLVLIICAQMLDQIVVFSYPSLTFLAKGVRNFVIGYAALCEFLSVCVHLDAQGVRLPMALVKRLRGYRDKMEGETV